MTNVLFALHGHEWSQRELKGTTRHLRVHYARCARYAEITIESNVHVIWIECLAQAGTDELRPNRATKRGRSSELGSDIIIKFIILFLYQLRFRHLRHAKRPPVL